MNQLAKKIFSFVAALNCVIITSAEQNDCIISCKKIAEEYNIRQDLVEAVIERVKTFTQPMTKTIEVINEEQSTLLHVTRAGIGVLTTEYGDFYLYNFTVNDQWKDYLVLVKAKKIDTNGIPIFENPSKLLVRIDSGCVTGQAFGDKTCECREQLHLAMKTIAEHGEGIIVNIPHQDGRGMGLAFKLATLMLQHELNINTVEAAKIVANNDIIDIRTYTGVIGILRFFEIHETTISLATNNPKKVTVFTNNNYTLEETVPVIIPATEHTSKHLAAKKKYLGHTL